MGSPPPRTARAFVLLCLALPALSFLVPQPPRITRPLLAPSALPSLGTLVGGRRGGPAKHASLLGLSMVDEPKEERARKKPEPSIEFLEARSTEISGELKEIEENMLASLRRRRRLIKRLGLWEQMRKGEEEEDDYIGQVCTFCTCEEFNMPHALRRLRIWSGGNACFVDEGRVLHVKKSRASKSASAQKRQEAEGGEAKVHSMEDLEGDIFVFPYGVLVCWGLDEDMMDELLEVAQFFAVRELSAQEEDDFQYSYGKSFTYDKNKDCIVLVTPPEDPNSKQEEKAGEDQVSSEMERSNNIPELERNTLEKLAASHGFAQSSKLSSFAESVQTSIIATRGLAAELAANGDIVSQSQKDIARNLGQLVLDRHTIYLYADVLDSPEVCWENPEVDPLYRLVASFLELSPRVDLLNKRVEVVRELLSLLSDELKTKHASRLEEIIIYLIALEIVLSLIKDIVPLVWETVVHSVKHQGKAAVGGAVSGHALVGLSVEGVVSVVVISFVGVCLSGIIFAGAYLMWEAVAPVQRLKLWLKNKNRLPGLLPSFGKSETPPK